MKERPDKETVDRVVVQIGQELGHEALAAASVADDLESILANPSSGVEDKLSAADQLTELQLRLGRKAIEIGRSGRQKLFE